MKKVVRGRLVSSLLFIVLGASCASYTVPGRAADLSVFTEGEEVQSIDVQVFLEDETPELVHI